MQTPLTADTRVHEAIRLRPLLAHKLDAHQIDVWERPQATLREVFPGNAGVLESLLKETGRLAVPGPDSRWRELSAAHLLDFLTHNHREFFGNFAAGIARAFADREPLDAEAEALRADFEHFARELRVRADSDERELFPRVLRYEACLRDSKVNPEFNGGSLRIAVAYRTGQSRAHPPEALAALIRRLREDETARGDAAFQALARKLEEFRERLAEHERLKAEVLYPRAIEAEKALYNRFIDGSRKRDPVPAA